MTVGFALTLVGLGFIGAFVAGLVGVGGAIVMIPLLYYVPPLLEVGSLDIKAVAGVTMTQVLSASAVGAWTHGRSAHVHRRLALVGGLSMALGSLAGAVLSRYVSARLLLGLFAIMTTIALPLMLISPAAPTDQAEDSPPPFRRMAAVGYPGAIGLASGMVGAGGAFLLLPVLIGLMRVPVRLSIGTSLAMTGMAACMGFLGKLMTGQVPLWPSGAVVLGSLCGARAGSMLSRQAPVGLLRGVLAILIGLVTVRIWIDVLSR